MTRPDGMQLFLQAIRLRIPRMEKATCSKVTVEDISSGEFTVVFTWVATKVASAGEHRIHFDRRRGFGSSASMPPLKQRLIKKVCRFHDDIISEVLRARGVK